MGNCIRHESGMQWGGDDWGSTFARSEFGDEDGDVDATGRIEVGGRRKKGTEVKIKMSKKQLEELLKKLDAKDKVSVHRVISRLLRMSDPQRSWRPDLASISEI
ncbi:hypothetical protein MLD38_002239 [Melastoma candidum]|uniref:Uncharacterized protein n=1 Tax=Melastoma candidum TaxID=119954 RepID=A0ACB9SF68_9MYRT|nr:hypothetical protein MLD38_002239 [Melastoma candidum]